MIQPISAVLFAISVLVFTVATTITVVPALEATLNRIIFASSASAFASGIVWLLCRRRKNRVSVTDEKKA
jgi:hypothetical protein